MADSPSREVRLINLEYLVAMGLLTVMVTLATVELFPALSIALAVRVWVELVKVVVSRGLLRFAEVEVANRLLSIYMDNNDNPEVIWPFTTGSEAEAWKVMVPVTVPDDGEVMETVGGVVS